MTDTRVRIVVGVFVLILLGVLGYFGFIFVSYQSVVSQFPDDGESVVFIEQGVGQRYIAKDNTLIKTEGIAQVEDMTIIDEVASPLQTTEKIILASAPGFTGIFAAVLHADNTVTFLMTGDTNKANLSVSPQGVVVFTSTPVPPALSTEPSTGTPEGSAEDTVVEEGSADGPVDFGFETTEQEDVAQTQIVAVQLEKGTLTTLGVGESPRMQADGSIIAIAPEGIVRIDPVTREKTVLFVQPHNNSLAGSISPAGDIVALVSADGHSLDFFSLSDTAEPVHIGFLERDGYVRSVSFIDEQRLFLRMNESAAWLYSIPTENLPVATPHAIVSLLQ